LGTSTATAIVVGYIETDLNGEKVEEWAESKLLSLMHDPKLSKSFNRAR